MVWIGRLELPRLSAQRSRRCMSAISSYPHKRFRPFGDLSIIYILATYALGILLRQEAFLIGLDTRQCPLLVRMARLELANKSPRFKLGRFARLRTSAWIDTKRIRTFISLTLIDGAIGGVRSRNLHVGNVVFSQLNYYRINWSRQTDLNWHHLITKQIFFLWTISAKLVHRQGLEPWSHALKVRC